MRISSANIGMESSRSYSSFTSRRTSALLIRGNKGILKDKLSDGLLDSGAGKETEQTEEDKKNALKERLNGMNAYSRVGRPSYLNSRDSLNSVRHKCMQYLMKILFGETKRFDYEDLFAGAPVSQSIPNQQVTDVLYYHQETYFEESETTSFSASGTVKCEDGREISINMNVEMSRSFSAYYEYNYAHIQARMCDPLVINFNGNSADLSDQTFFFDIDADGEKDEISMLTGGSGYLALDKNGDGIINDGNELFGAKSGNGFSDLAAYDSDGNGWIDENDAIWEKLLIWTKDEEGNDKCYKLAEKGIGAVCLSNASTDFSLNSSGNKVNGMVRKTGIFLYENGKEGTVQHVDIVKHQDIGDISRRYEDLYPFAPMGQLDLTR